MQDILVSIIIPVYKVEAYIIRCIDSVLNQTYRHLEIILVDDCSPDRSMIMAREYIEQSPLCKDLCFIFLKHNLNRGLSAARNTGILKAKGDYLFFLDSDDTLLPQSIEILSGEIKEKKYDLICGKFDLKGKNRFLEEYLHSQYEGIKTDNPLEIISHFVSGKHYMMAWNKLVNRDFLLSNKLFFKESIIHEDELWSFIVANKANSLLVLDDVTYCYYFRADSIMTSTRLRKSLENRILIIREFDRMLKENEIPSISANIDYIFLKRNDWTNQILYGKMSISDKLILFGKCCKWHEGAAFLMSFFFTKILGYIKNRVC